MTRTLIVDDDEVNLLTTSVLVEELGHTVVTASSLAKARAALAAGTFDLAILDVHLGDGLGLDLLPEIRARSPRTVVAILTGSLRSEDVSGADLVLAKGDDPRTLLASLVGALRRGR